MKVSIEIKCDNAAFRPEPGPEIGCILEELAVQFRRGRTAETLRLLRDSNGTLTGKLIITVFSEGIAKEAV